MTRAADRSRSPNGRNFDAVSGDDDPQYRMLCSNLSVGNIAGLDSSGSGHSRGNNSSVDFGILITLNHGVCELRFCSDHNFEDIHPNCFAPAALQNVKKLGGGGSGVAVFEGSHPHPQLGDLVMKHGGDKDMEEFFALATIAEELTLRSSNNPRAAEELRQRIPEFKMLYISPHHLGEKRRALWQRLRHLYKYSSRNLLLLPKEDEPFEPTGQEKEEDREPKDEIVRNRTSSSGNGDEDTLSDLDCSQKSNEYKYHDPDDVQLKSKGFPKKRMAVPHVPSRNTMDVSKSGTVSGHRHIAVYASGEQSECSVELLGDSLRIFIPEQSQNDCQRETGEDISRDIQIHGDGYQALSAIVRDLVELMKEHKWKFTFGQKRIGGDNPKTGNMWLYARKLEGKLLDNLITEKIRLVQDLASLTTEEEKDQDVLKRVRQEVAMFEEEEVSPDQLSAEADSFVGNAIKKNFKAETGRFPVLMMLGKQFREFSVRRWSDTTTVDPSSSQESLSSLAHMDELVLTKEEEIPARHLGALTRPGALMGDTFENVPLEQTVLDTMNPFYWRNLLRAAVQPRSEQFMDRTSSMALTRIWTCGLTDAGLHNLFLTEDSLWLFDLGQPQLHSAPGFLTKFLFSFFHTLGMQEKEGSTEGEWVRRFDVHNETDKLRLTKETGELLASAYEAFGTTLDRIVMELFDGDDGIRWLLIQYVTLQLLSDASFCLQRWTVKGGGRTRSYNHQKGIEKWLWRALWDMYVAFEINSRETWSKLNVEHPSHRESVFYSDMSELLASGEHRTSSRSRSSLNRMFDGGSKPLEPMSESENEDESEGE